MKLSDSWRAGGTIRLAFSADGRRIVCGTYLGEDILVWDLATVKVITGPFCGQKAQLYSIAFSPDGSYICSGSKDGIIRLWVSTDADIAPTLFHGHTSGVTSVAFSSDGHYIVSGSDDKTVRIWDIRTPQLPPRTFQGHSQRPIKVLFPPGRIISSSNREIDIWDLESEAHSSADLYGTFSTRKRPPAPFAFTSDGRYFAYSSQDGEILVWDTCRDNLKSRLLKSRAGGILVADIAFSPDDKCIASLDLDGVFHIWNLQTCELMGMCRTHIPNEGYFHKYTITFSPDCTRIALASEAIEVLNIPDICSGQLQKSHLRFWVSKSPTDRETGAGFWWREQTVLLGGYNGRSFDFTNFVHGTRWIECRAVA